MSSSTPFRALITGKDRLLVRLIGPVTEVADFGPLQFSRLKPLELDLSEMTEMNSIGIREFVDWSAALKNPSIEFSHCPKNFIDQVNMVHGLVPQRSKFLSFYVPYYNSQAESEKKVLFSRGLEFNYEDGELKINLPVVKDADGRAMEIDVIPERYFKFLKNFN